MKLTRITTMAGDRVIAFASLSWLQSMVPTGLRNLRHLTPSPSFRRWSFDVFRQLRNQVILYCLLQELQGHERKEPKTRELSPTSQPGNSWTLRRQAFASSSCAICSSLMRSNSPSSNIVLHVTACFLRGLSTSLEGSSCELTNYIEVRMCGFHSLAELNTSRYCGYAMSASCFSSLCHNLTTGAVESQSMATQAVCLLLFVVCPERPFATI